MALRNIVKFGDPILRKTCRPVEKFDQKLWTLLDDMKETLEDAEGVGLAAPQVGLLRRIFIVDTGEKIIEAINPEITETSGEQDGQEGCLSYPNKSGYVVRPSKVKIRAYDRNGKRFEAEGEGLIARAFCHENDHLDGILFIDKTSRIYSDNED